MVLSQYEIILFTEAEMISPSLISLYNTDLDLDNFVSIFLTYLKAFFNIRLDLENTLKIFFLEI